jgi:drug/metabolite transporter (DMT)-like permease
MLQGNALLALAAAVLWGGGDFSGGMGVRYAGGTIPATIRVVMLSHAASLSVLVTIALLRGDVFPHGAPLAWGISAGVTGGLSLMCFYVALSRGAMGTSAALSGLLAAAIPAAVAIAQLGSPGWIHIVGFVVAGTSIWVIAAGENPESKPVDTVTTWLAIIAGAGFGLYFVELKYAGTSGVIWPLATARIGSLSLCLLLSAAMALKGGMSKVAVTGKVVLWVGWAALLDTSGNGLFLAATRAGRLDIAAVLASLYPASTILLAAWMLREKPTRRQGWGMALAAAAVAMITL